MSRAYTNLLTHLVFGTKYRQPLITPDIKPELHAYLGGLVRELGGKAYAIGGIEDHVHLLVSLPPKVSISDAIKFIKANSTGWVKSKFCASNYAWQGGYGAFSVGKKAVPNVVRYIQNQEEHHRKIDFQTEFEAMLKRAEVEFDEYLWK
jgi:putative transposase